MDVNYSKKRRKASKTYYDNNKDELAKKRHERYIRWKKLKNAKKKD